MAWKRSSARTRPGPPISSRTYHFPARQIVLAAVIGPQKHSGLIVSWGTCGHKRVGLHYIAFLETGHCKQVTCAGRRPQNSRNRPARHELGLNKPNGYLLGSYRIATAPEPNSSRLTSLKDRKST